MPDARLSADAPALHARAMDNLSFIRATMERATAYTAVSGWGFVAMAATVPVAALLASRQPTPGRWALVWIADAALAFAAGSLAIARKARRTQPPGFSRPVRRLLLSALPPLLLGAALTAVLLRHALVDLLPGVWLLCYGTAVATGGAYSPRTVPAMGLAFMALGALALGAPATWGTELMVLGFGALHAAFGLVIARRHGG